MFYKAISPLLRSDFEQSTAGQTPNGDLTDSIVPATEQPSLYRAVGRRNRRPALGKVAEMHTQPTIEPTGSPVPGVIPEPARAHRDTVAAHERPAATPTASGTTKPASTPGRRNPASIALARLLSALRGDKYMVDAYPPAWHRAAAARAGDEVTPPSHNGNVAAGVSAGAASEPDTAAVASRTKER